MEKRENQRIALTKRMLKQSLLELMAKKRIQKITVSELCENAQINRSTFYNHYGSPADILAEIEQGVIDDLKTIWTDRKYNNSFSSGKRVESMCAYLREHADVTKLLFRDSDVSSGFASLIVNSDLNASFVDELPFAADDETKALITTFLNTGAYHMIRQWLLEDIPKTPKEIGELALNNSSQG